MALLQRGDWLSQYIEQNDRANQIQVYLEFHGDRELRQGKKWSHFGALRYNNPRDQRQWLMGGDYYFDPGNWNYKEAVQL